MWVLTVTNRLLLWEPTRAWKEKPDTRNQELLSDQRIVVKKFTRFVLQILIHGSMDSTLALAKHCQENSVCLGDVFSPSVGETIDATTERHIFQVCILGNHVATGISFAFQVKLIQTIFSGRYFTLLVLVLCHLSDIARFGVRKHV